MTGLALLVIVAASPGPSLEEARAAETAALNAELQALQTRLGELQAERRALRDTELGRIRELTGTLEGLRGRGDQLAEELDVVERGREDAPSDAEAIRRQAADLFASEAFDYAAPPSDQATSAAEILNAAAAAIEGAERVSITKGHFYGPSGRKVEGEVAHIGAVAAFGRAEGLLGPLVQLDGRHAMLEPRDVGQIFGAPGASVVPLLIGELPPRRGAEETTIMDRIDSAGVLAWPILALGLLVLLLAFERAWALWRVARGDLVLEEKLAHALGAGLLDSARALVEGRRSGVARLTQVMLAHQDRDREARLELAQSALVHELARAEARLGFFKLAAGVAPLLGLLGTVVGMIETFDVISLHGSGDASRLSGGISKALITTELGLIVAVPTLFLHSLLASRVDRIVDRLERVARDFPVLMDSVESPPEPARLRGGAPELTRVSDPDEADAPDAHRQAYG